MIHLVGLVLNLLVAVQGLDIRGVSPDDQHLYQPDANGNWHCLNDPSIVLLYDQINDDFCDCPDGSDEPATNACQLADQRSYCANLGHVSNYIENFKLNDGVCDYDICCDGSDEYLSGNCPNKCAAIHSQYEKYKKTVLEDIERSMKIKTGYVEEAAKLRSIVEKNLKRVHVEIERKERELVGKKDTGAVDEESKAAAQLSNDLENLINQYQSKSDGESKKIEKLEEILSKLINNYNPNFNDLAVKEGVNSFQDYISNKKDTSREIDAKPILESVKAMKGPAYIPSIGNLFNHYYDQYFPQEISEGVTTADDLVGEIDSLKAEILIYNEDLNSDFGENDILRSVSKSWVNTRIGEYSYELGFLKSIYQDKLLIGKYDKYEDGKLHFVNGAKCWNGPHRSAIVELICGSKNRIISVSEATKCHYHFEVTSPIACTEVTEEDLLANFKIDYDKI